MANEIILFHYTFSPYARRCAFPRFHFDVDGFEGLINETGLSGTSTFEVFLIHNV
jgi:hypothetical protein